MDTLQGTKGIKIPNALESRHWLEPKYAGACLGLYYCWATPWMHLTESVAEALLRKQNIIQKMRCWA